MKAEGAKAFCLLLMVALFTPCCTSNAKEGCAMGDREKIVVTVADSEADIFDLFNQERPDNSHLLIRGTHNCHHTP